MFELGPISFEHKGAIIATFIGFAMLLAVLYKYAIPVVRTQLNDRTTKIAEQQTDAERHLADAQQLRNDYANRIASIEVEHRARLEAAVRDSDAARATIIRDAEEVAKAIRRRAEEEVGREQTRQRILLRQQIVQATLNAAEQAAKDNNSDLVQRKLIADFIGRIGNPTAAVVREAVPTAAAPSESVLSEPVLSNAEVSASPGTSTAPSTAVNSFTTTAEAGTVVDSIDVLKPQVKGEA